MWWMWMGAVGAAEPVSLETWMSRLGAAPLATSCRIDASADAVRVDRGGTALLLTPAGDQPDAARAAIDAQLAPFAAAGMAIAPVAGRACQVGGVIRDCLEATVVPPVGAPMVVLSGTDASASWVGTCLHRGETLPEVCRAVFSLEPH